MGFSGKSRALKSLQAEITSLQMACSLHGRMPEANRARAEALFACDIDNAVDRAVQTGDADSARELLTTALNDPASRQGGLSNRIITGALKRIPESARFTHPAARSDLAVAPLLSPQEIAGIAATAPIPPAPALLQVSENAAPPPWNGNATRRDDLSVDPVPNSGPPPLQLAVRRTGPRRRSAVIAAVLVGVLVLVGAVALQRFMARPTTPFETRSPAALTGSEIAAQTAREASLEEFIASFDIPASQYSTPEAITVAYAERTEYFVNAGLTLEHDPELLITDEVQTVRVITERFDDRIVEHLYASTPETESLVASMEGSVRKNTILGYWLSTGNPEDPPYAVRYTPSNIELISGSVEAGQFVVHVDIHVTDNGNDNIGDYNESVGNVRQMDVTRYEEVTLVEEEGTWRILRIDLFSDSLDISK